MPGTAVRICLGLFLILKNRGGAYFQKMTKKDKLKKLLKTSIQKLWKHETTKWIVAIILAFIIWNLILIPSLRFLNKSPTPIVTIMTNSMEHYVEFDDWWVRHKGPYTEKEITKENFTTFPYVNGLNVGDMIFVIGKKPEDIQVGDILIFETKQEELIIHRTINKWIEDSPNFGDRYLFQTKGDNHYVSIQQYYLDETRIPIQRIKGVGTFRIRYIGMPKVWLYRIKEKIKEKIN